INTTYEGVHYNYMMRVGETSPRVEKLMETAIDERNGTEIKVYIKKGTATSDNYNLGDLGLFIKECKRQLFYFDNVYFNISDKVKYLYNGSHNYTYSYHNRPQYDEVLPSNDYTVYEGKHFKYRTSDKYPFTNLHLSIGKVAYPIDWDQLGETPIQMNIALKFNIGELPKIGRAPCRERV